MNYKEFLKYLLEIKNYSKLTIKSYKTDLEEFLYITKLNDVYLAKEEDIKKYYKYLYDTNKSNNTVCRKISVLKSYFKYYSRNYSKKDIMINFHLPKKGKRLPKYISYNELEEMIESSSNGKYGIRNRLIIELLYATGIRVSELVNIKLNDINYENNTILILGKGNKERIVYFGEYALEVMKEYINTLRKELLNNKINEYLLLNKFGNKISDRFIRNIIDDIIKRTSVKMKVSPHTLRHTFATHMLNEGCDLKSVQYLLGHKNLSTTEIYTHVSDERIRNVYLHSHPRSESEKL